MSRPPGRHRAAVEVQPWPALWALVIGFFMILVDSTIVTVATDALMTGLDADLGEVLWVTSAYLLAYAVPLLITGRLGDRFGPKRIYLTGLTIFTLSSLACGLAHSIDQLIAARVVQGLGAALMTPQTMAVITRLFPPQERGKAMGLWGATAGVATLVGPILGGTLIDTLGWEWIFIINVPVGLIAFVAAMRLVPALPTQGHSFDWLGVVLSAVGLFCVVFGIEEGRSYDWGTISGPLTIWRLIALGVVVLGLFVLWQARNPREPLVPLRLFRDRNFSVANVAITTVGFAITSMAFPLMLWAQVVRGYSPTRAACLMIPMAVLSGGLARWVGTLVNKIHPRVLSGFGLLLFSVSLFLIGLLMKPDTSIWLFEIPVALLGISNAFVWSPLSTSATANLPPQRAGAGAGVYNTTRQIGSVLGSAAIAVFMQSRIAANLPSGAGGGTATSGMSTGGPIPDMIREPLSTAFGQSMWLPAAVLLVGLAAALLFERPAHHARAAGPR
ncbi:DHA2 family efflux MFS transporter permease subunit [Arsenicicoccus piscis]|uniref:DHA2 family efflux MFS transporter permease subunit n=1 Tax=Arsenicicoccus piscis TaxID=673954 RepID=UPI001F4D2B87|nr:DHA2 family efflux MFS transporter permease subunit [Arsenicicoccus piscis]MCH8626706.1 DHA2 family efflux MFS transporter permease subunit [Arsenicicoccus piscis]